MSTTKIIYELENGLARITLNDPKVLNAMSMLMAEELAAAIDQAGREARALLITGAGRAFCSGADMSGGSIAGEVDGEPDVGVTLESHANPMMLAIRNLPIPIISAVRGPAAGVGCSIALASDIIVASENAFFIQSFVNIGLVPDGGSNWLLARAIGRVRALEMTLLGERLPAAKALEWGLITRVVPDDELLDAATAIAQKLANGPTQSIAMIRKLSWQAADDTFGEILKAERALQRDAGRTADHAEGVAAFLSKRTPNFTGK